jgi:hypothetical protein
MDNSSNNSTRTPPAENKETIQSPTNIKVKAMISATSGQGYTNDRTHIDSQENVASAFSKQMGKSSKKSRMTTEEARHHTKDSIKARKRAINKRTTKKMALTRQTVAAMDMVDASISPSTPKCKRTQQRSPGGTPDNGSRETIYRGQDCLCIGFRISGRNHSSCRSNKRQSWQSHATSMITMHAPINESQPALIMPNRLLDQPQPPGRKYGY